MATYSYTTTVEEDAGLAHARQRANQPILDGNVERARQTPPFAPLPLLYPDDASYWTARVREVLDSYVQAWRRERREQSGWDATVLLRASTLPVLDSSVDLISDLLPDQKVALKAAIRVIREP